MDAKQARQSIAPSPALETGPRGLWAKTIVWGAGQRRAPREVGTAYGPDPVVPGRLGADALRSSQAFLSPD